MGLDLCRPDVPVSAAGGDCCPAGSVSCPAGHADERIFFAVCFDADTGGNAGRYLRSPDCSGDDVRVGCRRPPRTGRPGNKLRLAAVFRGLTRAGGGSVLSDGLRHAAAGRFAGAARRKLGRYRRRHGRGAAAGTGRKRPLIRNAGKLSRSLYYSQHTDVCHGRYLMAGSAQCDGRYAAGLAGL